MLRWHFPEGFNEISSRLYPDATASSHPTNAPAAPPSYRPETPTNEIGNSFPYPEDNTTRGSPGTSHVQRGLDRAWDHLGFSPEARKETVDKATRDWMHEEGIVDLVKQRERDGARQVQKRQERSEPIVQDDNESVSSSEDSRYYPYQIEDRRRKFWAHDPTKPAPTDPYEVLGLLPSDRRIVGVIDRFVFLAEYWGIPSKSYESAASMQRLDYVYGEMVKAYQQIIERDHGGIYPDLHDNDEAVQRLLDLAKPGSQRPEPQKMYMHYTISQDRSGNSDTVSSGLLAVLGERSRNRETMLAALGERETQREARFKNANLALLSRGGR